MKRTLLLALALLCMSAAANARDPYVYLFAGVIDPHTGVEGPGGYDRTAWFVMVPEPYTEIEMWVWWYPDPVKGLNAVEFSIAYPSRTYVIPGAVTRNPLIVAELGNLPSGIASALGSTGCERDWFWSHHQTLTVTVTTPCGYVAVAPNPNRVVPPLDVVVASCEPGYPVYACRHLGATLYLNLNPNAIEDKTWGAIKSLYTD